jgi:hypothetical protein
MATACLTNVTLGPAVPGTSQNGAHPAQDLVGT